jgi:thiamine monophosphate synthase
VISTGIKAVAVTSAVTGADDPRDAARRLKAKLKKD